jgi:hypothetical protein
MHGHTLQWEFYKTGDINSCSPRQTLRYHNLFLLRLPCSLKRIMAFCPTLGEEQLQNTPIDIENDQLEGPWLGLVLRSHMGDRKLKIL